MTAYSSGGAHWARYEDLVGAYLLRTRMARSVVKVAHGAAWAPMLDAWANSVGEVQDSFGRRIILPDLQWQTRAGQLRWGEVKYKTSTVLFHVARLRRTGIDQRVFRHYQRIEELTGTPVDIFFCHEVEQELRVARLSTGWVTGVGQGEDMVYWGWDQLPRLATLTDLAALNATVPPGQIGSPLFRPRSTQGNLFDAMESP